MPTARNRAESREAPAPDKRPGADAYVYCKGCGTPLESRARLTKPRPVVEVMMCESCVREHNHPLIPTPGAPTFCYRCGSPEEVFIEPGTPPVTHHICERCLPDRAARYRAGNFEPVTATTETEAKDHVASEAEAELA